MKKENLEKFISRPEPTVKRELPLEEVHDFHRYGVMQKISGPGYSFINENIWPEGPFQRLECTVRIVKKSPPAYVDPHIEDHDQIQIFLGEPMNPESLSVEITLENQKFEVKSPFAAIYPKGLKHAEHIVGGCGWLVNLHLANRSVWYGESPESCPVQVGDEHELEILEVSRGGQGIAKINDFAVFVPGAKVGDHVKVKITRISQLAADAEIVK